MQDDFKGLHVVLVPKDNEWLAYLYEVPSVSVYASSPEEALRDLSRAVALVTDSGFQWPDPALRVQDDRFPNDQTRHIAV